MPPNSPKTGFSCDFEVADPVKIQVFALLKSRNRVKMQILKRVWHRNPVKMHLSFPKLPKTVFGGDFGDANPPKMQVFAFFKLQHPVKMHILQRLWLQNLVKNHFSSPKLQKTWGRGDI